MIQDKTLEKIIKFFNKIDRPIKIGLMKIPANSGKNVFIDKYVVIYCGKDIMLGEQKDKKFAFEEKEGIDLSAYCGEYFLNSEKLFRRLKEEGYELIYGE